MDTNSNPGDSRKEQLINEIVSLVENCNKGSNKPDSTVSAYLEFMKQDDLCWYDGPVDHIDFKLKAGHVVDIQCWSAPAWEGCLRRHEIGGFSADQLDAILAYMKEDKPCIF